MSSMKSKRKPTVAISHENYEKLSKLSAATGVPVTRLVDNFIFMGLNKMPYVGIVAHIDAQTGEAEIEYK